MIRCAEVIANLLENLCDLTAHVYSMNVQFDRHYPRALKDRVEGQFFQGISGESGESCI
jgi:hypothetical protein